MAWYKKRRDGAKLDKFRQLRNLTKALVFQNTIPPRCLSSIKPLRNSKSTACKSNLLKVLGSVKKLYQYELCLAKCDNIKYLSIFNVLKAQKS